MWLMQVFNFLLPIILLQLSECWAGRIYMTSCTTAGFSCISANSKYNVTYTCPAGTDDVTFYLWEFKSHALTQNLTIRNCKVLRLNFGCTRENRPIQTLRIVNVTHLMINKSPLTHNPPTIIFENIQNIDYIPTNTFSQIKKHNTNICLNPVRDLESITFRNVSIGVIAPQAFSDLTNIKNFVWSGVRVDRIQYSGVLVQMSAKDAFIVEHSVLEVLEHLAFKIIGPKVYFGDNRFFETVPAAINATTKDFYFVRNYVGTLGTQSFSVMAESTEITDNQFEYIKNGAFEKITPGIFVNAHISFANLKFNYIFTNNTLNFLEANSLKPDLVAYDNVATNVKFASNSFFCICENLMWLMNGPDTEAVKLFNEVILDKGYQNVCIHTSCKLPLEYARKLWDTNKCLENITAESLCRPEKQAIFVTTTHRALSTSRMIVNRSTSTFPSLKLSVILVLMALSTMYML